VLSSIAGLIERAKGQRGTLKVTNIGQQQEDLANSLRAFSTDRKVFKRRLKEEQKQRKKAGEPKERPRTYVLDFHGDIWASHLDNLRQEVTTLLEVAQQGDEVVVRLESPGGVVQNYGLAAA